MYHILLSIQKLFFKLKLEIFDIKKINTHGGSLRVFVKNKQNKSYKLTSALNKFLKLEKNSKIFTKKNFSQFNIQIEKIKKNIINLLLNCRTMKAQIIQLPRL